jgi:hypothetical protein
MMGKVIQKITCFKRAELLAAMDNNKAARRGFTSWDDEGDAAGVERVVPLVLGARPGTRDYWRVQKLPFKCV